MTAAVVFAAVVGLSALSLVVVPLFRPVDRAWLIGQAHVWFSAEPAAPPAVLSPTLRLDAGEDLRTGKLEAKDYRLVIDGDDATDVRG